MRELLGRESGRVPASHSCIILISSACEISMRSAELAHLRPLGARLQQLGHLDRLRVVADHALHELDVGGGEADLRQIDRARGVDGLARLAGCAGLDDGRWLVGAAVGVFARGAA